MSQEERIQQDMQETRAALSEKLAILEEKVAGTVEQVTNAVTDTVEAIKDTVTDTRNAVNNTVEAIKETVHDTQATMGTVNETVQESVKTVQDSLDLSKQVQAAPLVDDGRIGGRRLLPRHASATAAGSINGAVSWRGEYGAVGLAPQRPCDELRCTRPGAKHVGRRNRQAQGNGPRRLFGTCSRTDRRQPPQSGQRTCQGVH